MDGCACFYIHFWMPEVSSSITFCLVPLRQSLPLNLKLCFSSRLEASKSLASLLPPHSTGLPGAYRPCPFCSVVWGSELRSSGWFSMGSSPSEQSLQFYKAVQKEVKCFQDLLRFPPCLPVITLHT